MSQSEEIIFKDSDLMESKLRITADELPIEILFEGRKEYILRETENGGLVLNAKK